MGSKERFRNIVGQTPGKNTQEQWTMTIRKHKQNQTFFPGWSQQLTLLFSFRSAPPKLCRCSHCSVLQSGNRSSYCLELDTRLYVRLPCCPCSLCRPRWGWVLPEAGLFSQVPEGSDEGWGNAPGRGGDSSRSLLESPSPLKRRESLPCLCSLLVPILFNRLRLMSRGSGRDQPGCLIKGLQLSPAVWGFV